MVQNSNKVEIEPITRFKIKISHIDRNEALKNEEYCLNFLDRFLHVNVNDV
jgi:hypothetical protein